MSAQQAPSETATSETANAHSGNSDPDSVQATPLEPDDITEASPTEADPGEAPEGKGSEAVADPESKGAGVTYSSLPEEGLDQLQKRRFNTLAEADPYEDMLDAFARQPVADSTRDVYRRHWRAFAEWCEENGRAARPATPRTVRAFAISQAEKGLSPSTIRGRIAAIQYVHKEAGETDPTDEETVLNTMGNIERQYGEPATSKTAALSSDVAAMVRALPGAESEPMPDPSEGREGYATYLRGVRDRAMILVGFFGALRRSEIAGIERRHVTFNAEGFELMIPKSKGDQEGEGRVVGINEAEALDLCPVRALRRWLKAASIEEGAVFRGVPRSGRVGASSISGQSVAKAVKKAADAAGLDPEDYSGHSLRRGHLTMAAKNGADLPALQRQAGHSDPRTTAEYVEDAKRMEQSTSRKLGL